jgi:hypothetical protein
MWESSIGQVDEYCDDRLIKNGQHVDNETARWGRLTPRMKKYMSPLYT